MPPPAAMKAMRQRMKKAVRGHAVKIEQPVAMKAMKVINRRTAMKVQKAAARKHMMKAQKVEATVAVATTTNTSSLRAKKVETPGSALITGFQKQPQAASATKESATMPAVTHKRTRSVSSVPLVDAGCVVDPFDDSQSCLARLQKALAVPIAEPINAATPQRPTAASEKATEQWHSEPFSSSQTAGCAVEPGAVLVGGNRGSWTCSCRAHLRRHPRCGGEGPVRVHLTRDVIVVGRGESCHMALRSIKTPQMISRNHAVIRRENSGFVVADQGSLNGVLINGERVLGERAIRSGDIVTFGAPIAEPEFDYIFEERPKV